MPGLLFATVLHVLFFFYIFRIHPRNNDLLPGNWYSVVHAGKEHSCGLVMVSPCGSACDTCSTKSAAQIEEKPS